MNDSPNPDAAETVPPVPTPPERAMAPLPAELEETRQRVPAAAAADVGPAVPNASPSSPTAQYPTARYPAAEYPPAEQPTTASGSVPPQGPPPRSNKGLWIALAVVGGVIVLGFLILVILAVVAFTTARHWTKVDEPAHPETYHVEQYQTGDYDVTNDRVDLCTVNQDWTDCINVLVAEYNGVCADVPLTADGQQVCDDYSAEIDRMKSLDAPGTYVSSLGTYGTLTRTPEVAERKVSNNDATPARTHRATCYLGFIGECRGMPEKGDSTSGTGSSA